MLKARWIAAAITLAFAGTASAEDGELAKIRAEIAQMKRAYEQRIEALEKRLTETEAKAGRAEQSASNAQSAAATVAGRGGDNAFNPAISMVLQGTYARTTRDPESHRISGFMPSGGEVGPPKRSFGLAETELAISANIDPYFRGVAIAALAPEGGAEVEEAYFQTLALPAGLIVKGGRFFSGIGYLNGQHQHTWDFQDAPLPYKAFLGSRLIQDGLQLKWVAPTDLLVELGGEISSGEGFPGSARNRNGIGGSALFGHVGGDIGTSYAWRSGLSYLRATPQNRVYTDVDSLGGEVANSFTGKARMWVADAVLKWAPGGNSRSTSLVLQGEYFRLAQDGRLAYDDTAGSGIFGTVADAYASRQSGWYLQGIYKFMPAWRVGYRHDQLNSGSINNGLVSSGAGPAAADFSLLAPFKPVRNTLMFDWSPTEFSRIRLQFARDRSSPGATDNQVVVQYIHSLGAHGAHQF